MYSNTEKAGGSSHDRERRSKTAAAVSVHNKNWPKSEEADSKQSTGARQAKARPGVNSVLNKIDPSVKDRRGSCKKENTDSKVISSNCHFGLEKASTTGRDKKMNGTSTTTVKPRIGDSGSSKVDWPKSICFINNDDKFVAFGPGLPPGPHLRYCRYRWCSINGHKHPPTEEKSLFQRRKRLGNQTSTPLNNSSLQTSIRRQYRKGSKTVLEYSSSVDVKPIYNYDEDTDLIDLLRRRDISFIENFAKGKEETSSSGNSDVECEQTVTEVDDDQLRNCSSSVSTEADDNIDKYSCGFFPTATLEEAAEDGQKSFHELDLAQDEQPSGSHLPCFINRDEEDRALINLSSCDNGPDLAGNGRDEHSHSECSPEDINDKQPVMKESSRLLNCSTLVVAEVDSDEHGCSCSLSTSIKLEEAEDGQDNLCEPSVHSTAIGDEDTISTDLLIFPDNRSCDSESSLVGNTANGDKHGPSDCFPEHIGDMEDKHAAVKQEEDGLLNCRNPVAEEVDNDHKHDSSCLPTSMRLEEADDGQNISRKQSSSTEDLAQVEEPDGIPVPSPTIGDEDSTLIFLLSLPDSHSCDCEPSSPIGNTADADDELSHSDFSPEDIRDIEDAHTAVKLEDDGQLLNCSIPVVAEADSEQEHECGSVPTLTTLEEAENGQNNPHKQSSWTEDLVQGGELNGITVPSTTVGGEHITLIFLLSHSCDNEPSPIGNATDADENSHNDCSPEDIEDMEDTHIAVKLEEDHGLLNCSTPVAEKADNDHERGCSSFPASIRLEEAEDGQNNVCESSVVMVDLVQDEEPNGSPTYSATIGDEDTISIDLLSLPDSRSCGIEPPLVWHARNADEDNRSNCVLEHNGDIEDKHAAVKQEDDGLLNCRIPVVAKVSDDNELGCSSLPVVMRPEEAENGQNNSHEQFSWTEDIAQGGEPNGTPVLSITIGDEDTTLIYLLSPPDSHSCGNKSSLIGNTTNTDEHNHSDCSPESIRDSEDNYAAVELEEGGQLSWGIPIVAEVENDEHECSSSFSTSVLEDAEVGQDNSHEQSSWTEDNSVQGGEPNGTPVPSTTIGGEDTLLIDLSGLYDSRSRGTTDGPIPVGGNATNTDEHSHSDCSLEGMEDKQTAALKEGDEEEEEEEDGHNNSHHEDLGQSNDSHVTSATFGDGPDGPSNAGNADAQYNHSESSTVVDIRGTKDIKQGGVRRGSAANGLLLSCRSMPKLGAELEVHNGQAAKGAKNAHYNHCHNSLVRSYTEGAETLADYYCAAASDCQSGADGVIKRSRGGWHRKRQGYGKIREEEAETVNLRHGIIDERRLAEEYMIDFALVHAIRRLAGARKETGVKVLVSAFETVVTDKNHQAAPRPPFYIPRKNNNARHHLPQLLSVVLQC